MQASAERKSGPDHDVERVEAVSTDSNGSVRDDEKAVGKTTTNGGPEVHQTMNIRLFMGLTCMCFLWVGSQIPLYLYGSVLPTIYADIGGVDRYVWFVLGYLIPNAALCPFVGAFSDLFGRKYVGMAGQLLLLLGPIITATAKTMNIAIAGQVFSGLGAGVNELIALAGTGEMVPVKARAKYVGLVVFSILPFCPAVVYAQLITRASNWRMCGILICVWNFIGLLLCIFCYHDPPRITATYTRRDVLRQVDYIGGLLSTSGITCFMMGLQWGAQQYAWGAVHQIVPFILGVVIIIAFFVWEYKFAPHPMVPRAIFSKARSTMIIVLLITFLSGGNYFVMLLFWPTEVYNVYGNDPIGVGVRSLPIGFGIIGGAVICLTLIAFTKGQVKLIMIFFTALMTAGTGAMSIGNPHNIGAMAAVVTFAAIGVGGVIIPCSIIAQIACPDELIATITAITLSIRHIGGAIGFAVYYNIFYHKFREYATRLVALDAIIMKGIVGPHNVALVSELVDMVGTARFEDLKNLIATSPLINRKHDAYNIIVAAAQEAFALAYRYPYWISIAFGSVCVILALFITDIKRLMTDKVAAFG